MSWGLTALVISVATSAVTADQQARGARKSARATDRAQDQALNRSISEERLAAQNEAKANQKKPDIDALLLDEKQRSSMGPGSTILAGRGKSDGTLLGKRSTLLGGGGE